MSEWPDMPTKEAFLGLDGSASWHEEAQTPREIFREMEVKKILSPLPESIKNTCESKGKKRHIPDVLTDPPKKIKVIETKGKENALSERINDNKFICPVEGKIFPSYQTLNKHWKQIHVEEVQLFLCPIGQNQCNALLKIYDVQRHLVKVHHSSSEQARHMAKNTQTVRRPNKFYENPGSQALPSWKTYKDSTVEKPDLQSSDPESTMSTSRDSLLQDLQESHLQVKKWRGELEKAQKEFNFWTDKYKNLQIMLDDRNREEIRAIRQQLVMERNQRKVVEVEKISNKVFRAKISAKSITKCLPA